MGNHLGAAGSQAVAGLGRVRSNRLVLIILGLADTGG